jgi:hypothetical protein
MSAIEMLRQPTLVNWPIMLSVKQILRSVLLVVLGAAELWLLTGFLPRSWQKSMYARIETTWPSKSYDYSRTTHPALDDELQAVEPLGTALLTGLVIVNGGIIVALWVKRGKELPKSGDAAH